MPYTTLGSATAGQVYTAAAHNAIIGNLNTLGPAAFNIKTGIKTDTTSYSLNRGVFSTDVFTVSITPSAATSKVLLYAIVGVGGPGGAGKQVGAAFSKNSTIIAGATGDAAGSRTRVTAKGGADGSLVTLPMLYVDSPATTSAVTYGVQVTNLGDSDPRTVYINRHETDTDAAATGRGISFIVAIEIPV